MKKEEKCPKGFFSDWAIDERDHNQPADEKQNGDVPRMEEEKDHYVNDKKNSNKDR